MVRFSAATLLLPAALAAQPDSTHFAIHVELDALFDPRRSIEAGAVAGGTASASVLVQMAELEASL